MRIKLLYIITVIITALFFVTSCETNEVFGPHPDKIISSNPWVLKRLESSSKLETFDIGCNIIYFNSDSTFRKTDCNGNDISRGSWEFLHDYSYIKIGPNTFKIISISKKVMNLRYGEMELCFLPVK
jgi:hypothetical protein